MNEVTWHQHFFFESEKFADSRMSRGQKLGVAHVFWVDMRRAYIALRKAGFSRWVARSGARHVSSRLMGP